MSNVTRWHDTPLFDQIRDARVDRLNSTDSDEAESVCRHITGQTPLDSYYFMRGPISGKGRFMCRACCTDDVTLELLLMADPPLDDASREAAQAPTAPAPDGAAIHAHAIGAEASDSSGCR